MPGARAGIKTIDRTIKELWRDGWVQIPEIMVSGCIVALTWTLLIPLSLQKVADGPRDFKFRDRYEVIRKDEIPPYLRDYPDCLN